MSDTGFESSLISVADIRRRKAAMLRAKNADSKLLGPKFSKPKKQEPKAPEIIEIDPLSLQWL